MDEKQIKKIITDGRKFMQFDNDDDYISDQEKKLPQPPLVKAASSNERIFLPKDFVGMIDKDFTTIIYQRKSSRVFTQKDMTLKQLSYLLWASQGVKEIRGKSYATIRTVPSGGARHGFETYLIVNHCEGLKFGLYHYLPLEHALQFVKEITDIEETISISLCEQDWAKKANVVFYWSFIPYRCEWRYGIHAHRVALIDAGHVGQNLYLACTALGLGTCGVAAFNNEYCEKVFGLNNDEEYIVYTAPVGTIDADDLEKEQGFYTFVEEQGL